MAAIKLKTITRAWIQYNNAGVLANQELYRPRNFGLEPQTNEQTFEGAGQVETDVEIDNYTLTLESDYFDLDAINRAVDQIPVVTGLGTAPDGSAIASRTAMGGDGEVQRPFLGLYIIGQGEYVDTAAVVKVGLYMPKIKCDPATPASPGSRESAGTSITGRTYKTSQNIIGGAIPGVETGGNHYFRDILS